MTPADVISEVRVLTNDTDSAKYRLSDATLLKFVNDALTRVAILRPDLFAVVSEVACVAGEVMQSAPADCLRIIEVFGIAGGAAVYESTRDQVDRRDPTWRTATAGAATTWMRHARVPNKFFISPPAPVSQSLDIEYAQFPPIYTLTDTISLNSGYLGAVVDITVSLAQSIDTDHVESGRASQFLKQAMELLGVSVKQQTDMEP